MYCPRCHAGSDNATANKCPQCTGRLELQDSPFPAKPMFKSSGNPNGKTAKRRNKSIIKETK